MLKQAKSIKYKSSCGKLIHYSVLNDTYRIMNEKDSPSITKEEFKSLNTKPIKSREFARELNTYFREVKAEWTWQGKKYKKLPNFDPCNHTLLSPYNWDDIPKHRTSFYDERCILVFHWGRLAYLVPSYNGESRGYLLDFKTKKFIQWASAKNCAPIFNITDKRIC